MTDKFPICNGQVWKTSKETFAPTIQIFKVSNGEIHAAYFVKNGNRGIERVDKLLSVEQFVILLDKGRYLLDYSPPDSLEPFIKLSKFEAKDSGKKYLRTIRSKNQRGTDGKLLTVDVDIYCVIDAYGPFSAPMNHAIKKVLCAGARGGKDKLTDLKEAIVSIQHEIESETDNVKPEPEQQKPKTKEPILPPPENTLPPFVQRGDRIYVGRHEGIVACHEFYEYTAVRGEGLRKTKQKFVACRFCGTDIKDTAKASVVCPKLNSP